MSIWKHRALTADVVDVHAAKINVVQVVIASVAKVVRVVVSAVSISVQTTNTAAPARMHAKRAKVVSKEIAAAPQDKRHVTGSVFTTALIFKTIHNIAAHAIMPVRQEKNAWAASVSAQQAASRVVVYVSILSLHNNTVVVVMHHATQDRSVPVVDASTVAPQARQPSAMAAVSTHKATHSTAAHAIAHVARCLSVGLEHVHAPLDGNAATTAASTPKATHNTVVTATKAVPKASFVTVAYASHPAHQARQIYALVDASPCKIVPNTAVVVAMGA